MKKFFIAMTICTLFFTAQAGATTYTFQDDWIDWPETDNSTQPGDDDYGTPQIDTMTVTLNDSGFLQRVDIALEGKSGWQEFNSLFINSYAIKSNNNQWDDWDYFAHDGGSKANGDYNHNEYTDGNIPDDGIFSVKTGGYNYTMTQDTDDVRGNTPNGIDAQSLNPITSTDKYGNELGWDKKGWTGPGWDETRRYILSYSFADINGLSINLSDGFFIAFAPYCANDVIGGSNGMNPVPEPTTMALLGIGLIGLARMGRKKMMK